MAGALEGRTSSVYAASRPARTEELLEQRRSDPPRRADGIDGNVHEMPRIDVARADQIAEQAWARTPEPAAVDVVPLLDGRQAHAGRSREFEHEHRQRPRGGKGSSLDRDYLRQIGVGQRPNLVVVLESHRCIWIEVTPWAARRFAAHARCWPGRSGIGRAQIAGLDLVRMPGVKRARKPQVVGGGDQVELRVIAGN